MHAPYATTCVKLDRERSSGNFKLQMLNSARWWLGINIVRFHSGKDTLGSESMHSSRSIRDPYNCRVTELGMTAVTTKPMIF